MLDPDNGLIVEIPVPCRDNGEILSREMIRNVRQLAREREILGVVANGPTAENSVTDQATRARILEIALTAAPREFPVYATVKATDDSAGEELEAALIAGAAGAVVESGEAADVERHAEAIIQVANDGRLFARNADVGSLGVDYTAIGTSAGPDVPMLLDDAALVAQGIAGSSAVGAVLSSANVAPEMWAKMFALLKGGKGEEAETMYRERFAPLTEVVVSLGETRDRGSALAVKHALFVLAHNVSDVGLPEVTRLEEDQAAEVEQALKAGRLMGGER